MSDLTITLADIRNHHPCAGGWTKLLTSLGGSSTPLDTRVSLGDVARSNGEADAWWCVKALDWSDVSVRRAVIAALLPSLRRAAACTTDKRVHNCLVTLARWCAGEDVDLRAVERAARAADAAWAAAWAARAADAAGAAAEREAQRSDLIAAFPPLHGGGDE